MASRMRSKSPPATGDQVELGGDVGGLDGRHRDAAGAGGDRGGRSRRARRRSRRRRVGTARTGPTRRSAASSTARCRTRRAGPCAPSRPCPSRGTRAARDARRRASRTPARARRGGCGRPRLVVALLARLDPARASPSSPFVHVTTTVRTPSSAYRARTPPVLDDSSSGCACTAISVSGVPSPSTTGLVDGRPRHGVGAATPRPRTPSTCRSGWRGAPRRCGPG